MAELIALDEAQLPAKKGERLSCKEVAPGVFALYTVTQIEADVTIDTFEVARVQDDGEKATPYADEAAAEISVDKHGRIWIAGYNVRDMIDKADDRDIDQTETAGQITRIDMSSAKVDALLGVTSVIARTDITYFPSGNLDTSTRSLVITP